MSESRYLWRQAGTDPAAGDLHPGIGRRVRSKAWTALLARRRATGFRHRIGGGSIAGPGRAPLLQPKDQSPPSAGGAAGTLRRRLRLAAAAGAGLLIAAGGHAQVIYNNSISAGTASFDATVQGASPGSLQTLSLSGLSAGNAWNLGPFSISATGGTTRPIDSTYLSSGQSIGINPTAPVQGSGLTFNFAQPINAFGLEVGDWATCCYPSSLYISFDGGANRLVATATSLSNNPGSAAGQGARNFVAGIDTSNTFSTVTFYGDGIGEYMVAGGTIRWATLAIGSVPDPAVPIPEPGTYAMMLLGLAAVTGVTRRRQQPEGGGDRRPPQPQPA